MILHLYEQAIVSATHHLLRSSPLMSEVTMPGSLSGVKAGTIPLAPARRATQM
jgi:hypothetical protein